MTPKEIDIALSELEERVDRLRALYEQYFMGYEKLEPTIPRKDVDRRFAILRKESIRNTAQRFKLNVLTQKFNTYAMYWQRICRQIEEGTYKRHIQRAKKRFGDDAPSARREADTSFDVELTDFDDAPAGAAAAGAPLLAGLGGDDVDAAFEAAVASAPRQPAPAPVPPKAAPAPYRSAMGSVPDGVPAPEGGVKRLVRKKDGTLGPVTPATPFQPVGMPGAPPATPAAARPAAPPNRLPAALPPGAPTSTPRIPNAPLTGRLPAAPPPGGPGIAARPPSPPPSVPRPAQPSSPGPPTSSPRFPAAPPPGAPARVPLPSAAGSGAASAPLSSPRPPPAPPSTGGAGSGPSPSQRFPAAPPPGGPRPMIRPIPGGAGGVRRPSPSSPDLGDGVTRDRDRDDE